MNKKILSGIAVIIGILFVAIALYYWFTPAGSLMGFVPGYLAGSTHVHVTHGIAALVIGLLAFAYAWFASAKPVQAPTVPTV